MPNISQVIHCNIIVSQSIFYYVLSGAWAIRHSVFEKPFHYLVTPPVVSDCENCCDQDKCGHQLHAEALASGHRASKAPDLKGKNICRRSIKKAITESVTSCFHMILPVHYIQAKCIAVPPVCKFARSYCTIHFFSVSYSGPSVVHPSFLTPWERTLAPRKSRWTSGTRPYRIRAPTG